MKNSFMIDIWKANLPAWKTFLQTIGQKNVKDYRFTEKLLCSNLQTAEFNVQAGPSNVDLLNQAIAAKDALSKHQQTKIHGARIHSRINWLQHGDQGSKFVFNFLKQKQIKEAIDKLVINNQEVSNPACIFMAFVDYYSKLFSSEDSLEAEDNRFRCRPLIPTKLDSDDVMLILAPISIEEIKGTIKALKDDKAPKPDGLSIEFYKANLSWISKDLFDLYNEAISVGSLSPEINKGIIKLLPKEGDKTLVKNWRPISLLNVSYKILAKILALRLAHILPKFVNSSQTGFIKGRYILENLITAWEAMDWGKCSHQNSALLLLDFEKAYDRVEWKFIIMMLQSFGFPPYFCKAVQTLLTDACAQIEINGSISDPFPLSRSIRQGCPLTPALFVIVVEALYYILRDDSLSPEVRGLYLPNN